VSSELTIVNWCPGDACDPCYTAPVLDGHGGGPGTGLPAFTDAVVHINAIQEIIDDPPNAAFYGQLSIFTDGHTTGDFGSGYQPPGGDYGPLTFTMSLQILSPFDPTSPHTLPTVTGIGGLDADPTTAIIAAHAVLAIPYP
jgi:hypothetical protein